LRAIGEGITIFKKWNLDQDQYIHPLKKTQALKKKRGEKWEPPPLGFLKLNFNSALKGNLGTTRAGGVIRDSTSTIQNIFTI
jgi:hypothetical protein